MPRGAIGKRARPEFIDLITSENKGFHPSRPRRRPEVWLDNTCIDRYGKRICSTAQPDQQKEILDLIAYKKNVKKDPSLGQGIEFFSFLRKLTADGFFTSAIGIEYLGYIGNTFVKEFPGCPPVPGRTRVAQFPNCNLPIVIPERSRFSGGAKDLPLYLLLPGRIITSATKQGT